MKIIKKNIIKYNGTLNDFYKEIGLKNETIGILSKKRGVNHQILWWEDKDKWFMNDIFIPFTQDINKVDSTWIIAKDLDDHLKPQLREGYELYLYTCIND